MCVKVLFCLFTNTDFAAHGHLLGLSTKAYLKLIPLFAFVNFFEIYLLG
jgi:hypothetical protein